LLRSGRFRDVVPALRQEDSTELTLYMRPQEMVLDKRISELEMLVWGMLGLLVVALIVGGLRR
jgi:hypothetical protein